MITQASITQIIAEVRPYSMVSDDALALTIERAIHAIESERHGDLVECGTWLGGASFAMLLAQRHAFGRILKPVWMFDSFAGLPPAEQRDGPLAIKWQHDITGPIYYDNCKASLAQVQAAVRAFEFSNAEAIVVPGWFHDTIPQHLAHISERGISLLRVDCDWYNSVHLVLEQFVPLVSEDGTIIIDDYFAWDGCTRATHAYLASHDLAYRIRSLPSFSCAWMVKRAARALGDC